MRNAVWVVSLGLLGCGTASSGNSGDPQTAKPGAQADADGAADAKTREAMAYDTTGEAKQCEKPADSCVAPKMDPDLQARCVLAGYRMAQCGCEMWCMGKPQAAEKTVYDAEGNPKACAKPTEDCSPPSAKASFQDACTDRGFRLETCGCEWLCSGNPTK